MKKIAKFEKVSFGEFFKAMQKTHLFTEDEVRKIYDSIKLPKRATTGSAGYDFFMPITENICWHEEILIPTGIRCKMEPGWVLKIYPRSGLGFKYRIRLNNTVGIIDSDYYFSDNEGHIMIKVANEIFGNEFCDKENVDPQPVTLEAGNGFAQGIFVEYGITEDDEVSEIRNGGFGSTTKS